MSTDCNEDCRLIEAEARSILPDGAQVECEQDALSEDFTLSITNGGERWEAPVRNKAYYETGTWRRDLHKRLRQWMREPDNRVRSRDR